MKPIRSAPVAASGQGVNRSHAIIISLPLALACPSPHSPYTHPKQGRGQPKRGFPSRTT